MFCLTGKRQTKKACKDASSRGVLLSLLRPDFIMRQHLALEAIRTANLSVIKEPQTIKKQKQTTEASVTAKWAERWHQNPRTSMAYKTALAEPPDGRTHHTFQPRATQDVKQRDNTPTSHTQHTRDKVKVKFTRLTHTMLYRFITGHAFTGEFTQRFYPPPHAGTNSLPVWQARTDNQACAHGMPPLHCRTPKAPHH